MTHEQVEAAAEARGHVLGIWHQADDGPGTFNACAFSRCLAAVTVCEGVARGAALSTQCTHSRAETRGPAIEAPRAPVAPVRAPLPAPVRPPSRRPVLAVEVDDARPERPRPAPPAAAAPEAPPHPRGWLPWRRIRAATYRFATVVSACARYAAKPGASAKTSGHGGGRPGLRGGSVPRVPAEEIAMRLRRGDSMHQVHRDTGAHAKRIREIAMENGYYDTPCDCGRPRSHPGRCQARRGDVAPVQSKKPAGPVLTVIGSCGECRYLSHVGWSCEYGDTRRPMKVGEGTPAWCPFWKPAVRAKLWRIGRGRDA